MKRLRFARHVSGSTAIEFGLTAPLFLLVLFGLFEGGIGLWTYFGLHSAAESAARLASITASSSTCTGSGCVCSSGGDCVSSSAVQTYASQNDMGLNLPSSVFSLANSSCGWQVSATYTFTPLGGNFGLPDFTFTAQACYPS